MLSQLSGGSAVSHGDIGSVLQLLAASSLPAPPDGRQPSPTGSLSRDIRARVEGELLLLERDPCELPG
jgi:hypothetical protein